MSTLYNSFCTYCSRWAQSISSCWFPEKCPQITLRWKLSSIQTHVTIHLLVNLIFYIFLIEHLPFIYNHAERHLHFHLIPCALIKRWLTCSKKATTSKWNRLNMVCSFSNIIFTKLQSPFRNLPIHFKEGNWGPVKQSVSTNSWNVDFN